MTYKFYVLWILVSIPITLGVFAVVISWVNLVSKLFTLDRKLVAMLVVFLPCTVGGIALAKLVIEAML